VEGVRATGSCLTETATPLAGPRRCGRRPSAGHLRGWACRWVNANTLTCRTAPDVIASCSLVSTTTPRTARGCHRRAPTSDLLGLRDLGPGGELARPFREAAGKSRESDRRARRIVARRSRRYRARTCSTETTARRWPSRSSGRRSRAHRLSVISRARGSGCAPRRAPDQSADPAPPQHVAGRRRAVVPDDRLGTGAAPRTPVLVRPPVGDGFQSVTGPAP
jgi:hypothetical protein